MQRSRLSRKLGERRGDTRSSALWGKGGQGVAAALAVTLVLSLGLPGVAAAGKPKGAEVMAALPDTLRAAIQENPNATFSVIIQGDGSERSDKVADKVAKELAKDEGLKGRDKKQFVASAADQFQSIDGLAAELSGDQIRKLLKVKGLVSIVPNVKVALISPTRLTPTGTYVASSVSNSSRWASRQVWPASIGATWWWQNPASTLITPTIAVIDSGIDTTRPDLAGRVVAAANVVPAGRPNTFPGDGFGHGTFVASVAAGSAAGYAGASPNANLLSVDVVDDTGGARISDVIDAADWVLRNKDKYNIRVANFSLRSSLETSIAYDPLNAAVERLWLSGIVVVAASGNYGSNGQPSGVKFAPGNDPFVITVGAADTRKTVVPGDDVAAPWSSYGYTPDGFAKPELTAPGRFMVGAVPPGSALALARTGWVIAPGYMQMSGTSFSAPVVAGAAANLLVLHPNWTPDQVKGALMLTATSLPQAARGSVGVGEINVQTAAAVTSPPNPNQALNPFVVTNSDGGRVFDAASWYLAAKSNASWHLASWSQASWNLASWWAASWHLASWHQASWTAASWNQASWHQSAESTALAGTDNAATDGLGMG